MATPDSNAASDVLRELEKMRLHHLDLAGDQHGREATYHPSALASEQLSEHVTWRVVEYVEANYDKEGFRGLN